MKKKKKSRVKNIFIQKVNSSLSLEEIRKVEQKLNKCGHPLKQSISEDLSVICKGQSRDTLQEVSQRFW